MNLLVPQLIEGLHEVGKCPRLVIDATREGVELPQWVREKWGESMPIDLDPRYPLELKMDERGLRCCLSFGGPVDCYFPWESIYLVQDRETALGLVVEENLPPSVTLDADGRFIMAAPRMTDSFPVVKGDRVEPRSPSLEVDAVVDPKAKGKPALAAARAAVAEADDDDGDDGWTDSIEETAQRRRAMFKVIDGGQGS